MNVTNVQACVEVEPAWHITSRTHPNLQVANIVTAAVCKVRKARMSSYLHLFTHTYINVCMYMYYSIFIFSYMCDLSSSMHIQYLLGEHMFKNVVDDGPTHR